MTLLTTANSVYVCMKLSAHNSIRMRVQVSMSWRSGKAVHRTMFVIALCVFTCRAFRLRPVFVVMCAAVCGDAHCRRSLAEHEMRVAVASVRVL